MSTMTQGYYIIDPPTRLVRSNLDWDSQTCCLAHLKDLIAEFASVPKGSRYEIIRIDRYGSYPAIGMRADSVPDMPDIMQNVANVIASQLDAYVTKIGLKELLRLSGSTTSIEHQDIASSEREVILHCNEGQLLSVVDEYDWMQCFLSMSEKKQEQNIYVGGDAASIVIAQLLSAVNENLEEVRGIFFNYCGYQAKSVLSLLEAHHVLLIANDDETRLLFWVNKRYWNNPTTIFRLSLAMREDWRRELEGLRNALASGSSVLNT